MKKLFIAVLLTLVGFAFAGPSFAIEHEFGGYWRVRMFTQKNFDGKEGSRSVAIDADDQVFTLDPDDGIVKKTTKTVGSDVSLADTRTRLYYTATINDNLKFVNKFEMDATWGTDGYGDVGSDGVSVEVKNSYADFNLGSVNLKVGTQGATIHRGFVFDDDFSGVAFSSGMLSGLYAKVEENGLNAGDDVAAYHLAAAFDLDTVKLTPAITYVDMNDGDSLYYLGLDVDASFNAASVWGSFIYNGGEAGTADVSAWLAAAGMTYKLSDTMDIHGQAFYATGDNNDADTDEEAFQSMPGQSYYWSEIMGYGIFDNQGSNNAPADAISNITAVNIGATVAPMDKLTCSLDIWYATQSEVATGDEEDLGLEVDLVATYQLVDGLSLDVVGAYLFADDGTTENAADDENPWEVGTRLSLSF